jgi:hypothetical protein
MFANGKRFSSFLRALKSDDESRLLGTRRAGACIVVPAGDGDSLPKLELAGLLH